MKKINWEIWFWAGLGIVMLLRVFYFGFTYFNYLDDNNTYGIFFRRNADIWNDIILWYGLYTFRPIAFFSDAYITQWFWPRMQLVLLFYTVMSFATLYLFKKVLEKSGISFGVAGLIVCALVPLNIEAVYWIGASTRFVPGMFFSILSCYVLVNFLGSDYNRKFSPLILYFLFNLIATGFYEQIIVFNFVFTLLIIALHYRNLGYDKAKIITVPFASLFIIAAYYLAFWNHGKVATRGAIVSDGFISHFAGAARNIWRLVTTRNFDMINTGFFGFFDVPINILQILILLLVLAFAYVCASKIFEGEEDSENAVYIKALVGLVLAIAPFAPFFLLENNFMAFRNVFPSVFGIAMIIDAIVELISRFRIGRMAAGGLTGVVCVVFFLASVTEINNYRLIEIDDHIIAANFLDTFRETGYSDQTQVIVLNSRFLFTETSREGFENISSSDWAFLGKLNAHSDEFYFRAVFPVVDGWGFPKELLDGEVLLLGMDCSMNVFHLMQNPHHPNRIYEQRGIPFGRLSSYGENYIFTFAQFPT